MGSEVSLNQDRERPRHVFRLEINSLEDFERFVSIIRGKSFKLDELAKELDTSTVELLKAEENQKNG